MEPALTLDATAVKPLQIQVAEAQIEGAVHALTSLSKDARSIVSTSH